MSYYGAKGMKAVFSEDDIRSMDASALQKLLDHGLKALPGGAAVTLDGLKALLKPEVYQAVKAMRHSGKAYKHE